MSLFGTLNTGVSGMAAQANMLSTIGDNIANSSTDGYKRATVDFETQLGNQTNSDYTSGGVQSKVRYGISEQGTLASTTSVTDLAIKGNGFFVVQGANGSTAMTRAGSFVPDSSGDLVNTAGYKLMGYNLTDGSSGTANGIGGLQVINLSKQQLNAAPSQTGTMEFNVNSNATVPTGPLPSANAANASANATADGSSKTSIVAYDDLGNAVTLDVYLTKTQDSTPAVTDASGNVTTSAKPAQWEAAIYDQSQASGPGYKSGPLNTQTLDYDGTTGKLTAVETGGKPATAPLDLTVQVPNGKVLNIDVSQTTQLASTFTVNAATIDGSAPSKLDHVTIGTDGTVTSVYANGVSQATYRIPLADVPSAALQTSTSSTGTLVTIAQGRRPTARGQPHLADRQRLPGQHRLGEHDDRHGHVGHPRRDRLVQPRELHRRPRHRAHLDDLCAALLRGQFQGHPGQLGPAQGRRPAHRLRAYLREEQRTLVAVLDPGQPRSSHDSRQSSEKDCGAAPFHRSDGP